MRTDPRPRGGTSPVVLALDTPELATARAWARAAGDAVAMVKVGLELWTAAGPDAPRALAADGHRVMLDLKLHDIPGTVGAAVAAAVPLGAAMVTVHAGGGAAMLAAAVRAAAGRVTVAAVTVLTSLTAADLATLGLPGPEETVPRLARAALAAGCGAVVCSPLEAASVRAVAAPSTLIVCPGIRPAAESGDDQRRFLTPAAALRAGADLLVVGRPITRHADVRAAARALRDEALAAGGSGGPERLRVPRSDGGSGGPERLRVPRSDGGSGGPERLRVPRSDGGSGGPERLRVPRQTRGSGP
jgi:orotidine-5'-phosphate decarboxylase